jgi:hypothetical protein
MLTIKAVVVAGFSYDVIQCDELVADSEIDFDQQIIWLRRRLRKREAESQLARCVAQTWLAHVRASEHLEVA